MANMPTRQKILLIIMVMVLGYYGLDTWILSSDTGQTDTTPGQQQTGGAAQTETRAEITQRNVPQTEAESQQQPVSQGAISEPEIPSRFDPALGSGILPDPFRREIKQQVVITDSQLMNERLAKLNFTSYSKWGAKKTAVINERWYREGDSVDGLSIVEIQREKIKLRDEKGKIIYLNRSKKRTVPG